MFAVNHTIIKKALLVIFGVVVGVALLELGSYGILKYIFHVPLEARNDERNERALYIWNRDSDFLPFGIKRNFKQEHNTDEFRTVVKTNNVGMREDTDYNGEKIDIGFVGDSMTFGWGVNYGERYSDVLREYYPEKNIRSYGYLDGLTTPHYFLFLKNNPQYIPTETLVLGFFPHNDLDLDMRDMRLTFNERGEPVSAKFVVRYVTEDGALGVGYDFKRAVFLTPLLRHSYSAKLFWLGWMQGQGMRSKKSLSEQADDRFLEGLGYIEKIKQLADRNHTRLVVFLIPLERYFSGHPYDRWDSMTAWLRESNIEFIDPTSDFARRGVRNLYLSKDGHWNRNGHRAAAELLLEYLKGVPTAETAVSD